MHPPGTKTCTRSPFSLINNQSKTFHPCIVWLQRNDWNLECTLQHAPMRINSLCEKSLALFSTSFNLSANGVLTFLPFARCSIRIRIQEANCWLGEGRHPPGPTASDTCTSSPPALPPFLICNPDCLLTSLSVNRSSIGKGRPVTICQTPLCTLLHTLWTSRHRPL